MNLKKLKIAAVALFVLALAAPALEAQRHKARRQHNGTLQIIALQTYVEGRDATYNVKPADHIPVSVGERVKIYLVGTALIDNAGEEQPVDANFTVAAGRGNIEIVQTGSNWALVQVKSSGDDGMAQLGYEVNGDYEMKGGLQWGRITLAIEEGDEESEEEEVEQGRWDRAEELTEVDAVR